MSQANDYTSEVRFGVVMYGGVSLAIYINGVTNELYELCCATPKAGVNAPPPEPGTTRCVYRKLSWLLHDRELRARYLAHLRDPKGSLDPFAGDGPMDSGEQTRFVVDVVAGTSAGGINGIFLAKALANGEAFAPLKKLWVQEGDIGELLNDPHSYVDLPVSATARPTQSLLNSDRMYLKLLAAMDAMKSTLAGPGGGESALADEVDLYVTTTDIRGSLVPLRLSDKVVYEKRHKQVFHFQYAASGGSVTTNDFVGENNPFLAFAARCTSSFPFAFEPMQVVDAERLAEASSTGVDHGGEFDFDRWKRFFPDLSPGEIDGQGWKTRAFGDGGYLDNKPFSYVVEALSWRLGSVPIERKLLFVEPAPAHPENESKADEAKPDAIENSLAALTSIPQYETIREDLDAVLKRNRRIERIDRIVRQVETDVDGMQGGAFARMLALDGKEPDWSTVDIEDLVRWYGVAFLPYRRLRTTTVTDDIADHLTRRWGQDRHSDRLYAMRALVRVWRDERYFDHARDKTDLRRESISSFLATFDIRYQLRRVSFLLRRTHLLMRSVRRRQRVGNGPNSEAEASEAERFLRDRLAKLQSGRGEPDPRLQEAALEALREGFAGVVARLRRAMKPAIPCRQANDPHCPTLDQMLLLLIDKPNDLAEIALADGVRIQVKREDLPKWEASHTLQENVFRRAQGLMKLARDARGPTQLQRELEKDIADLGNAYQSFRLAPAGSHKAPSAARDYLGNPELHPVTYKEGTKVVVLVKSVDVNVDDSKRIDALNSAEGTVLRELLSEYYLRFDEYDQISFPLYYGTDTGEPATVEVVRVSPEDATGLIDEGRDKRRKLAGTFLHNFGAFLDKEWRVNDIMWGRLDGNERLLTSLLPDKADDDLRERLLGESQLAILREELPVEQYAALLQEFTEALARQGSREPKVAFQKLWAGLGSTDRQRAQLLGAGLRQLLAEEGLIKYVQDHYEVRRDLDARATLETASRAITIAGRILQEIEKKQRIVGTGAVWIARGGRAFQALVAVSVPGSLRRQLWNHWLALFYLFEIFLALIGVVGSSVEIRNLGLAAFVVTLLTHLFTVYIGDRMRRRRGRARAVRK